VEPTTAPPVPFALARAEYEVELLGDHARVRARLLLSALASEGWLVVPLLRIDEVALSEATLDGAAITLTPRQGYLGLCAGAEETKGERVLELVFLIGLKGDTPQAQGFGFAVQRTPITRLAVRGVRRDVLCHVRPGFGLEIKEEEGGQRVARAALPPTDRIEFSWRPEAEHLEPKRPAIVGGGVDTRISVGERALSVTARVSLTVSGGPAAGVELLLPAGFNLHSAMGGVVRDARPMEGDRLRVRFSHDLLGETQFLVTGEVPLDPDQEQSTAPVIALEAGPRTRGTVAVDADPRVEVELADVKGAARVDPSELTFSPTSRPTLLALKFVRARPEVLLGLRRHKDAPVLVATCDHAHFRALLLGDGKVFVKAHLIVRNNARSFLELRLPEGAELWSAYCGGQPARPSARAEEGGQAALIPLLTGEDDAFEVELAYFQAREPLGESGTAIFPLPGLDLPMTYVSLALFLPTRYRHFNFDGGLPRTDRFIRGLSPPHDAATIIPVTNVMTQSFLGGGGGPSSAGSGLGGEGQLPIRLPCLERGQEHRFEKTLSVGGIDPVTWEYKKRRRHR
jgi:hypothetical protein